MCTVVKFKVDISQNFVAFSEYMNFIENDHNFEQNEDRVTVFLKWTDFTKKEMLIDRLNELWSHQNMLLWV